MRIDQLKPSDYNPRTISEESFKGLSESLNRFGLVDPLIVNKKTGYTIVGGHQRYNVLRSKGAKEVQVVVVDLSEAEERALNVTLNNQHIAGDWSDDLVSLLDQIKSDGTVNFEALQLDKLLKHLIDPLLHEATPFDQRDKDIQIATNKIYVGDCIDVMRTWPANCIDTVITDAPYGLSFMGKGWDGSLPGTDVWKEVLRVAKPGAVMLAFGGTRTWHHLASAIEAADWEIHDCMMWLYGSGFPKSLDISKAIDKAKGVKRKVTGQRSDGVGNTKASMHKHEGLASSREKVFNVSIPSSDLGKQWSGFGTALKPAWEPIIVAMKPLDGTFAENAEKWGVAGINVDGGRIAGIKPQVTQGINSNDSSFQVAKQRRVSGDPSVGRWPANLLLDEDAAAMLDGQSGELKSGAGDKHGRKVSGFSASTDWERFKGTSIGGDSGGASRFFYTAKASKSERNMGCDEMPDRLGGGLNATVNGDSRTGRMTIQKNFHPTVKPISLMKYLCMLTKMPTGGIVLDPFCGSGTTLMAAQAIGRPWLGIEINGNYAKIARQRIASYKKQVSGEAVRMG